jgi:dTMP kinase
MSAQRRGRFIVLEGTDGSGKGTQFELLKAYLRSKRVRFTTVDFPQYGKPSAYFVEQYLNGAYGTADAVDPHAAAMFYALDRFSIAKSINEHLRRGKLVLANRYVASNMGHQGAKVVQPKKRKAFIRWIHELEYHFFKIPKPDLNIFLSVPPEVAYRLIAQKKKRTYIKKGKKRDIHEADRNHLARAFAAYLETMRLFRGEFKVVECAPHGLLRSISDIHREVVQLVKPHITTKK